MSKINAVKKIDGPGTKIINNLIKSFVYTIGVENDGNRAYGYVAGKYGTVDVDTQKMPLRSFRVLDLTIDSRWDQVQLSFIDPENQATSSIVKEARITIADGTTETLAPVKDAEHPGFLYGFDYGSKIVNSIIDSEGKPFTFQVDFVTITSVEGGEVVEPIEPIEPEKPKAKKASAKKAKSE